MTTKPNTWTTFLATITAGESASKIARRTGLNQSTVWRWLNGDLMPGAQAAITVARTYGANAGDALIAAGITTPQELRRKRQQVAGVSLAEVPTDVLLAEVGRRTENERTGVA